MGWGLSEQVEEAVERAVELVVETVGELRSPGVTQAAD
jgi:hypothetical protein